MVFFQNQYMKGDLFQLATSLIVMVTLNVFCDIIEELSIKIRFTYYEGMKRAILHTWPNAKDVSTRFVIKPYQ
jgi:hypothetical protein